MHRETSIVIASGQHDLSYVKMPGRLQIDLYNYFRRSVNLESYKLDYVSGYFIGDGVKKIEQLSANNFRIYSKNLAGLKAGDYINFEEIDHTVNKYNEGEKFRKGRQSRGRGHFDLWRPIPLMESTKKRNGAYKG